MLQQSGVKPDVIVCRTEHPLSPELRRKIALFCNVRPGHVIQSIDAWSIYQVPLNMHEEHLDELTVRKLQIENFTQPELGRWKEFLDRLQHPKHEVNITLVGKYVELQDAYKSILEAFVHAGAANECKVHVHTLQSERVTSEHVAELLQDADGILVAPGFGERGLEGKVCAVQYARKNGIPFLGICLGMQMCVVEFARHIIGWKDAASTEVNPQCGHPVICLMEDQKATTIKGGTMRLGAYACQLEPGSLAARLYGCTDIRERHRHLYEFNSDYLEAFEKAGLKATGRNPETGLARLPMATWNSTFRLSIPATRRPHTSASCPLPADWAPPSPAPPRASCTWTNWNCATDKPPRRQFGSFHFSACFLLFFLNFVRIALHRYYQY